MLPYTQLRKASRVDLAAKVPLRYPLTVYVEPTNRCNLSCGFCPQSLDDYESRTGERQDMPLSLWRKVMDEVRFMDLKSLKLYFFGEPLLHPQIGQMMNIAAESCRRVEITTNGMPLTGQKIIDVLESGIQYIRISIYPDVRPELVLRNVSRLKEMRDQYRSPLVICAKVFSLEEKKRITPMYASIVDEIAVEGLHTIGSEFVQISTQAPDSRVACPYPFYNLVVKSNGDVVPCCVAWEDSLVLGNVQEQSLENIWRGESLARIHRLHLEGRRGELAACASCDTLFNSPDSVDSLTVEEYDRRRG